MIAILGQRIEDRRTLIIDFEADYDTDSWIFKCPLFDIDGSLAGGVQGIATRPSDHPRNSPWTGQIRTHLPVEQDGLPWMIGCFRPLDVNGL